MERPTRVILSALLAAFVAVPLAACSCIWADHGFLVSSGTELPANARGVPWWGWLKLEDDRAEGRIARPDPRSFRVERVQETGPAYAVPFSVELVRDPRLGDWTLVLLVPSVPLEPGMRLRFIYERPPHLGADGREEHVPPNQVEVIVTDKELTSDRVDLELGRRTRGELRTTTRAGSCSTKIDAAQVEVGLPESVSRWGEALLYVTRVDGEVWRPSSDLCAPVAPGRSWIAPGRERLFAMCGDDDAQPARPADNLEAGTHDVEMVAWLPGTNVEVTASRSVRLHCRERRLD